MSFYCPNIDKVPAILKRIRDRWERDKSVMLPAGDAFSEISAYLDILYYLYAEQENILNACELSGEPEPFLGVVAELDAVAAVHPQSKTPEGGMRYSNPSQEEIDKFIESGPGELMLLDFQTGKHAPVNPRCAFSVQKWLDKSILFLESPKADVWAHSAVESASEKLAEAFAKTIEKPIAEAVVKEIMQESPEKIAVSGTSTPDVGQMIGAQHWGDLRVVVRENGLTFHCGEKHKALTWKEAGFERGEKPQEFLKQLALHGTYDWTKVFEERQNSRRGERRFLEEKAAWKKQAGKVRKLIFCTNKRLKSVFPRLEGNPLSNNDRVTCHHFQEMKLQ